MRGATLGPRGTGKSTWVKNELSGAPRIDLLDEERYHTYLARPGDEALADDDLWP